MFAKKLLGIVGLLFAGSQIGKVYAECNWDNAEINSDTPTCTGVSDCTDDEYGYYWKTVTEGSNEGSNVMVKVTVGSNCAIVEDAGYYIGKDDNKYYKVDYNKSAAAVGTSDDIEHNVNANCNSADKVGTLYNDSGIKLCILNGNGKSFGEGNYYLINDQSGVLKAEPGDVVVSLVDTDAIKVVIPDDSLVVSEIETITKASGEVQTVVPGKLVVLDSSSYLKDDFDCGDFCVDKTTRKLFNRKEDYCNGETECVGYVSCSNGICRDTTDVIAPRQTSDCVPVISGSSSCNGYYLYDGNDELVKYADADVEGKLVKCDGSKCSESFEVGYFVNADSSEVKYIKRSIEGSIGAIGLPAIGEDTDDTCTAGKLKYETGSFYLCIDDNNENKKLIGEGGYNPVSYLVDASTANTFIDSENAEGSSFVVVFVTSDGDVILETIANKYFIANDATKTLLSGTGGGKLYKCDNYKCKVDSTTIGYLKNADSLKGDDSKIPYIQCSASGESISVGGKYVETNSCSAIAKPGNECNDGDLIYNGTYQFCIGIRGQNVPASYLVGTSSTTFVNSSKRPSHGTYYVLVKMDANGNIIRSAQVQKKYIYGVTTSKRIFDKGEDGQNDLCTINKSPSTLKENATEYVLNYDVGDLVDFYKANGNGVADDE